MSTPKYAIVEQMGHRKFGAQIAPSDYGPSMRRVTILAPMPHDDPYPDGVLGYADISVHSLYAVTECDEATARRANRNNWTLREVVPQLGAGIDVRPADDQHDDIPFDDNDEDGDDESGERKYDIYVASSWRNDLHPLVVDRLRRAGATVYDFRHPEPGNDGFSWKQVHDADPKDWSVEQFIEALNHPIAQAGFDLDASALKHAKATVLVAPCGFSAALELGFGCGAKQKTYVLLERPLREPELMVKLADWIAVSIDGLIAKMQLDGVLSNDADGLDEVHP